MSETPVNGESESPRGKRWLWPAVIGGGLLAALILFLGFSGPSGKTPGVDPGANLPQDDQSLKTAQDILSSDNDLVTCKNVLQQMNSHLATHPEEKPGELPANLKAMFKNIGFKDPHFNEVDSPTFTLLDGHYLEERLMLREVARFLEPPVLGARAARPTIAAISTTAFSWTVRQIRQTQREPERAPPAYALRRGWGSAFERCLVFFSLLDQFFPPGAGGDPPAACMIFLKTANPNLARFWVAVVNEAGNDLYLFDPMLGLPLPGGQDGKPLLLTELRADPKKLRLLDAKDNPYDVQPENLSPMTLIMAPSISSFAPRMKLLEEKYLPAGRKARLYVPFEVMKEKLEKAARPALGPSTRVELFPPAVEILLAFHPQEEGGLAAPQRYQKFQVELIPQTAVPPQLARAPNEHILQQVGNLLSRPFIDSVLGGKLPRDLMIHARYAKAVPDLVREGDELRGQLRAAENDPALGNRVNLWLARVGQEYQNLEKVLNNADSSLEEREIATQRIFSLWKDGDADLKLLIAGAIGRPRGDQIAWMLALCKHELALQQERRFLSESATPGTQAVQDRLNKWKDAESSWRRYLEEFPTGAGSANAQVLRGQALVALGENAAAEALWRDLSRPMHPQEKCARLFLANTLKK